ncbi:MAG: hypothetical protein LBQ22_01430 [Bacteroidales bacterium]|jgi:hypothetical protein|nr:hypothetical protein [Bacteroidales bacterium]
MLDNNRIPEKTYAELCELMGKEEADKFIIENKYNFQAIQTRILLLRLNSVTKIDIVPEKHTTTKKDRIIIVAVIVILLVILILISIWYR